MLKLLKLAFFFFFSTGVFAQTQVELFNISMRTPYGWDLKKLSREDSSICIKKNEKSYAQLCLNTFSGKNEKALKNRIRKTMEDNKLLGNKAIEKKKIEMNHLKVQYYKWEGKSAVGEKKYHEVEYIFQYRTIIYVLTFRDEIAKFEASSEKILETINDFKVLANK